MTTEYNPPTDEETQRFRENLLRMSPENLAWFSRYIELFMQGDLITQQAQDKFFAGRISYPGFRKIVDRQHRLMRKNQASAVGRMLNDSTQGSLESADKDEGG